MDPESVYYSYIKVEEHLIDNEDFHIKKEINNYLIRDNKHLCDGYIKDEITLNRHNKTNTREHVYSSIVCNI